MELSLLLLCISLASAVLQDVSEETNTQLKEIREEMTRLSDRLNHQQRTNERQHNELRALRKSHARQAAELRTVRPQMAAIEQNSAAPLSAEERYQQEAYGCILDVINMTCPLGSHINITGAIYGQYANACSACCAPNQDDCYEHVTDNHGGDWLLLKATCDGNNTCRHEYPGRVINECGLGTVADYMLVQYDCLPSNEREAIAFSAYAMTSRHYYPGDIMDFDVEVTDLGGYYDYVYSIFTCPYHGAYVFSISITAQQGLRHCGDGV